MSSELDKFKRRMIRSVARQMIVEKITEDEMWDSLKNETGSNCKALWHRMRSLTLKKLNRLFVADDNNLMIPSFVKMSETDWLMFDLVLVHEDEDVIAKDKMVRANKDSVVLSSLFNLVQRFDIENLEPDALPDAWTRATNMYNTKGRNVSPMLLQRRWYQLKQSTRERFYDFWFAYRGNSRLWEKAKENVPTILQQAVALRYPKIITSQFLTWEEAIKEGRIVLPDDFEKHNKAHLPRPCDENGPDLVLVEPVIETIDLEEYISDDEKSDGDTDTLDEESISRYKVKLEPQDNGIDNEFSEKPNHAANLSTKVMDKLSEEETLLNMNEQEKNQEIENEEVEEIHYINIDKSRTSDVTNKESNPIHEIPITIDEQEEEVQEIIPGIAIRHSNLTYEAQLEDKAFEQGTSFEDGIPKITNVFGNVDITNDALINSLTKCTENKTMNDKLLSAIENEKNDDCEIINLDENTKTSEDIDPVIIIPSSVQADAEDDVRISTPTSIQDTTISDTKNENDSNDIDKTQALFEGSRNYLDFIEDGIELVDDGIEYVEDDESQQKPQVAPDIKTEAQKCEELPEPNEVTFDLKLLMQAVVYTTKLDVMKVFKEKAFQSVESKSIIDLAILESKPVSTQSLNLPNHINELNSDDNISMDSEDIEVENNRRVDMSSICLKKPRNCTYNPIQLCKNPDFNTRLKRLTAGFFSSSRNRFLLKVCKPMTVDLSKSFETKLLNGVMYLNSSTTLDVQNKESNYNKNSSVVPSAMPAQSLMNNTNLKDFSASLKQYNHASKSSTADEISRSVERNKTINLPSMSQVRLLNQRLLTAEVTPFQIDSAKIFDQESSVNITTERRNICISNDSNSSKSFTLPTVISDDRHSLDKDNEKTSSDGPVLVIGNQVNNETTVKCITNNTLQTTYPSKSQIPSVTETRNTQLLKKKALNYKVTTRAEPIYWYKKVANKEVSDALLTRDTLTKILLRLNDVLDNEAAVKKVNAVLTKNSQKVQYDKQTTDTITNKDITQTTKQTKCGEKSMIKHKKPKLTIMYKNRNTGYFDRDNDCCWARAQINKINGNVAKTGKKHYCKGKECDCCCKKVLQELIGKAKALKNACDSIETVVQQTREIIADRASIKKKTTTEVTTEESDFDIVDLSDDPSTNEIFDVKKSTSIVSINLTDKNIIDLVRDTGEGIEVEDKDNEDSMEINATVQTKTAETVQSASPLPTINYFTDQNIGTVKTNHSMQLSDGSTPLSATHNVHSDVISRQHTSENADNKLSTYVRCPCQKEQNTEKIVKVTRIQKKVDNICIDNSNEKVLILSGKQLSNRNVQGPICLGKNKILVSTVKVPSASMINTVLPQIFMPKEQIILPNAELSYSFAPRIDVDQTKTSQITDIINTHENITSFANPLNDASPDMNILKASTNVIITNENELVPKQNNTENFQIVASKPTEVAAASLNNDINISKDINLDNNCQVKENLTCIEECTKISNENKETVETMNVSGEEKVTEMVSRKDLTLNQPINGIEQSFNVTYQTSTEIAEKNTDISQENAIKTADNNKLPSSNRNTLLSDLMEMSGISAEDTTISENVQGESGSSMFLTTTRIITDYEQNQISNIAVSGSELVMQNNQFENVVQVSNLPQLNPVKTYADLKYACENDSSFFKLDYDTKTLVPIKVCIRKNQKHLKNLPDSATFIDLTEESLEDQTESMTSEKVNNYGYRNIAPKNNLKPLKAFKAIRSPIILRKHKTTVLQSPPFSILRNYDKKSIDSNENNISVVREDDSGHQLNVDICSNEKSSQRKRKYSSDSSDDEPLIAKVKRKQNNLVSVSTNDANELDLVGAEEHTDEFIASNSVKVREEKCLPDRKEIPENEISKEDVVPSATLAFMSDHSEVEEDCILGV